MAANNEIGTIANLEDIGKIAHKHDVLFHTDAAQAVGHIPIDVEKMNIDLMSFSSHKIYGPKGIGALYVRSMKPRVKLDSLLHGGGQERNIRSGTLNVPGIIGFAKAVEIAVEKMEEESIQCKEWTEMMLGEFEKIGGKLNGHPTNRLTHNLNVRIDGIESTGKGGIYPGHHGGFSADCQSSIGSVSLWIGYWRFYTIFIYASRQRAYLRYV